MNLKYTNERNIQMLIYLLKENGIKKIIVNPGTMNMSFVTSVQNDEYFELYSCVDERSACYMACGLACESNETVVLTCTGATASRNYMPGLTEAFYRKIPILTVTCTPHLGNIGNNTAQMIDRRNELNDTYKFSVYIPTIRCSDDEWSNNLLLNKALLELNHNGSGPVHINLGTEVTKDFSVNELPKFRKIMRYSNSDQLPVIDKNLRIGIFVGNHNKWSLELVDEVDSFCEKYNAVVICDHTSNYFGKYKVLLNILCDQEKYTSILNNFDLILHIGNTSGAYMKFKTKSVWRINKDGELRDTFKKLEKVFEMEEIDFFKNYNLVNSEKNISLYESFNKELKELFELEKKCEIPFSNIWISQNTISKIPSNSVVHLAILNSLRAWNYFTNDNKVLCYCNTGGFGIDGALSTMIGASLNDKSKLFFGVVGDLAFFYDLNSIGNRHINNNVRIMIINNGCGTEFHNYSHPANVIGDDNISKFIAADGHFGNKSSKLVKHLAEDLGFIYISVSNKKDFLDNIDYFLSSNIYDKPVIFEVFTDSNLESEALYMIRNLKTKTGDEIKTIIKNNLPKGLKEKIKKVMRK